MKHRVSLTPEQRSLLKSKSSSGRAPARESRRARILLRVDANGPRLSDEAAAREEGVHPRTVARVREAFARGGLEEALPRKPRPPRPHRRRLEGEAEARVAALACSEPPPGRRAWTLSLLADKALELRIVGSPLSRETVRKTLEKTR